MEFDFLSPVSEELLENLREDNPNLPASYINTHTTSNGFPDLDDVRIAIVGVAENRLMANPSPYPLQFDNLRSCIYSLFPGNWDVNIADLGDIQPGERVEDTYFALQTLVKTLVKKKIIPIILGGSQDLVYAQYRAYDKIHPMVNLVNIDSKFDLGNADHPISNTSYIGKIVVDKPYNLFNYSNIGYQTYFNAQEEINLMERLYFDAYRLGEVTKNINLVEPIMRDANLVALDINSIHAAAIGGDFSSSPNGFDGKEICALSRYAGISDKVSSFGIYEYSSNYPKAGNMLIAQIIWYFIEGVNYRTNENTILAKNEFIKYQVPIDDETLVFFKSAISGRWWIEIPFVSGVNNKLERHTLLPCSYDDYLEACNQVIPERWYKTKRKNEV